jgi:sterol desaturase/sphingolipid hydroxylase (fatty acid hydroxylase superfamily)
MLHLADFLINQYGLPELPVYCLFNGLKWTLLFFAFSSIYRVLKVHAKVGFFKSPEPAIHYQTSLMNWKIPFLWGIGITLCSYATGLNLYKLAPGVHPAVNFSLPEQFVFLHSPTIWTDILYAIVGFYLIDLTDYWAHRLNHRPYFYNKFPFSHFVHHNCVYVNPLVVASSPFIHLAAITGILMYVLMLSQGLVASVAMLHVVKVTSNFLSHLGWDPLPWLTRLNHKVGGWIPWIPLHHQYHHLPFVSVGNFGNVTCLWDYVFKTLVPECKYHLETGAPLPEVAAMMAQGDQEMERYLKGKTRFNLT